MHARTRLCVALVPHANPTRAQGIAMNAMGPADVCAHAMCGPAEDTCTCDGLVGRAMCHVAYGLWCAVRRCSSATRLC
eukprot:6792260-Prymnesium_polylepis.1